MSEAVRFMRRASIAVVGVAVSWIEKGVSDGFDVCACENEQF
jgi:hypothetical protein